MRNGNTFWPTDSAYLDVKPVLPLGTYLIGCHPMKGFYFEEADAFTPPKKIYGDTMTRVERVINTFDDRPNSTGVILCGEKGSGKTLLGKMLSIELAKRGVITLIVNSPFSGDAFNTLIQSVDQPAYVLFDEFEKVYHEDETQAALLTLFDGLFASKKLFGVTTNDKYKLSEFMLNRPGRFFYSFSYAGLDPDFIREYLTDRLADQSQTESFLRFASTFEVFNFDMLQALVEEMNRYDETVIEASKFVNVHQTWKRSDKYEIVDFRPVEPIENLVKVYEKVNRGNAFNPFSNSAYVYYDYMMYSADESGKVDKTSGYKDTETFCFEPTDIVTPFGEDDTIIFKNEEGLLIIKKVEESDKFDIRKYF
jgi:hypothetical protein